MAPRPRASRPARASRVLSECRVSCLASRAPPALPPVPPPRANRTACGRPGRFSATRRSPASRAQAGARRRRRGRAGAPRTFSRASRPPPPSPPRTKWTRRVRHPVLIGHARVRHPVLIGHAASLSQVAAESFAQRDGVPLRDARGAPLIDYQAAAPPGPPRSVCRRCAEPRGGPMRRAVRGRNRLVSFRLVAWRLLTRTKPTVFVSPRGVAAVDEDETGCFRFASWRGGC